jgi:hypothetical protein
MSRNCFFSQVSDQNSVCISNLPRVCSFAEQKDVNTMYPHCPNSHTRPQRAWRGNVGNFFWHKAVRAWSSVTTITSYTLVTRCREAARRDGHWKQPPPPEHTVRMRRLFVALNYPINQSQQSLSLLLVQSLHVDATRSRSSGGLHFLLGIGVGMLFRHICG